MTLQDEWDIADLRNERPEILVRCSSCGRLVDEIDGCENCDGSAEAELS